MNLFSKPINRANPEKIQQIKAWVYELLALDEEIAISINQLQCHEPDCPPVETVIAVMTIPPQQYKIHKSISEIIETDIKEKLTIKN